MPAEVHQKTVIIPANTAELTPYSESLDFGPWQVDQIDLTVPHGPSGLMGFYLQAGGVQWIPWESGEWFVWDAHSDSFTLTDQPNNNSWKIVGYNTDEFLSHRVIVVFRVSVAPVPPSAPKAVASIATTTVPTIGKGVLLG